MKLNQIRQAFTTSQKVEVWWAAENRWIPVHIINIQPRPDEPDAPGITTQDMTGRLIQAPKEWIRPL